MCGKSQNGKGYNNHTCTIKFIAESSITMILYRAIKAKNNSQFSYLIHTLAVSFIFSFWSFEISEGILDSQKIIIGLE